MYNVDVYCTAVWTPIHAIFVTFEPVTRGRIGQLAGCTTWIKNSTGAELNGVVLDASMKSSNWKSAVYERYSDRRYLHTIIAATYHESFTVPVIWSVQFVESETPAGREAGGQTSMHSLIGVFVAHRHFTISLFASITGMVIFCGVLRGISTGEITLPIGAVFTRPLSARLFKLMVDVIDQVAVVTVAELTAFNGRQYAAEAGVNAIEKLALADSWTMSVRWVLVMPNTGLKSVQYRAMGTGV